MVSRRCGPEKRNAADRALLRELAAAYTLLEGDPDPELRPILSMIFSFQSESPGFDHQAEMPVVPNRMAQR